MKIQGILDAVVDPEAVRIRSIPSGTEGMPKGTAGLADPAKAVKPSPPPPQNHSNEYSKELERIAEAIRKYIQIHPTSINISIDEELKQVVTRVLDEDSGEVIRQYPEDAALAVMKHLKELRGLLLNRKG